MYLDKLSTQGRVPCGDYLDKLHPTQRRVWVYLDKLSTQGRVVVISRQVINTGEGPCGDI